MYIQHQCLSRPGLYHTLPDFAPISRFAPGEVKQLILGIETTLHNTPPPHPFTATPSIAAAMRRADSHREIISIPRDELTNDLFVHLWARDDPYPLVVTPIPGQKLLQYPWTPKFFMGITGGTACNAQDCETVSQQRWATSTAYLVKNTIAGEFSNSRFVPFYDFAICIWTHCTVSSRTTLPRSCSRTTLHFAISILI
jgi:hypothetical protein